MNTEDREWVGALVNVLKNFVEWSIVTSEARAKLQMDALWLALISKELLTSEEFDLAKQELQAAIAVEEALNPDLQALLKDFNELRMKSNEPPE